MGNSNKIKRLLKKIIALLIKNKSADAIKSSEVLEEEIIQTLTDIKAGKYSNLLEGIDIEKDWKTLEKEIKRSKKSSTYPFGRREFWIYGVAASIVLLISVPFVFNKTNQDPDFEAPVIVNNNIESGTDKATLTLEDGSEVVLNKGTTYQTDYVTSAGEEIIYKAGKQNKLGIAYNTLTVPRGGQFYILLSDGTKVWLNSESQLKYPVVFNKGDTRQVELVYGEAYFDVSPSINHMGTKFKVLHKFQGVEVLGTEFNIKAYKDETNIYTTLVEGYVVVNNAFVKENLVPNQQLNFNLETNSMTISKVDVYNEISWKDGVFNFESMPLKDIMKVLSRWYDMEVVFENEELEDERFIGSFNKNLPIKDVFLSIKNTNIINAYEIENKTITIK